MAVTILYDNTGGGAPVSNVFVGDGAAHALALNIRDGANVVVEGTLETAPTEADWCQILSTRTSRCWSDHILSPVPTGLKIRARNVGVGVAKIMLS